MDKYDRFIYPSKTADDLTEPIDIPAWAIIVDVYSVLVAFEVTCPATQHAIKKLLCAGLRGVKSGVQDLREARDAIDRAIDLARQQSIEPSPENSMTF